MNIAKTSGKSLFKLSCGVILCGILVMGPAVAMAQDGDDHARQLADNISQLRDKMTKELHLSDDQERNIKPIISEYVTQFTRAMQEAQSEAIIDRQALRNKLRLIREDEYRKLAKFLTPDQLRQWIQKEKLRRVLNRDNGIERQDKEISLDFESTEVGAKMRF